MVGIHLVHPFAVAITPFKEKQQVQPAPRFT
jgi:hypothetical protein